MESVNLKDIDLIKVIKPADLVYFRSFGFGIQHHACNSATVNFTHSNRVYCYFKGSAYFAIDKTYLLGFRSRKSLEKVFFTNFK